FGSRAGGSSAHLGGGGRHGGLRGGRRASRAARGLDRVAGSLARRREAGRGCGALGRGLRAPVGEQEAAGDEPYGQYADQHGDEHGYERRLVPPHVEPPTSHRWMVCKLVVSTFGAIVSRD